MTPDEKVQRVAVPSPSPPPEGEVETTLLEPLEAAGFVRSYWGGGRKRWAWTDKGRAALSQRDQPGGHDYLSTACFHGLHDRCRRECKFCAQPCRCECHSHDQQDEQPLNLTEHVRE